jgi:hypothetical protein
MAEAMYGHKDPSAAHVDRTPAWSRNTGSSERLLALRDGVTATWSGRKLRPSQVPAGPADTVSEGRYEPGLQDGRGQLAQNFAHVPRSAASAVPADLPREASAHALPGRSLEAETRNRMEPLFGRDFGGVRVHTDALAPPAAADAPAYTIGRDMYFTAGRYAPRTPEGGHLLAHELAHVVQQTQPGAASMSSPVSVAEREARAAADIVAADTPFAVQSGTGVSVACAPPQPTAQAPASGAVAMRLPLDPSGLSPDWTRDPSHLDPNGSRWRHPSGEYLDFHRGRPGERGERGRDHWHHNGEDEHLVPGKDEIPDPPQVSAPPLPDKSPEDAAERLGTEGAKKSTETGLRAKIAAITGLTGAALTWYIIFSEGSRIVIPPRNAIPVP